MNYSALYVSAFHGRTSSKGDTLVESTSAKSTRDCSNGEKKLPESSNGQKSGSKGASRGGVCVPLSCEWESGSSKQAVHQIIWLSAAALV